MQTLKFVGDLVHHGSWRSAYEFLEQKCFYGTAKLGHCNLTGREPNPIQICNALHRIICGQPRYRDNILDLNGNDSPYICILSLQQWRKSGTQILEAWHVHAYTTLELSRVEGPKHVLIEESGTLQTSVMTPHSPWPPSVKSSQSTHRNSQAKKMLPMPKNNNSRIFLECLQGGKQIELKHEAYQEPLHFKVYVLRLALCNCANYKPRRWNINLWYAAGGLAGVW